MMAWN